MRHLRRRTSTPSPRLIRGAAVVGACIGRNGTDVVATFATGFAVVNHTAVESLTL